jgi:putative ATP-binding cassette transporter
MALADTSLRAGAQAEDEPAAEAAPARRVWAQLLPLLQALRHSRYMPRITLIVFGIVVVVCLNAVMQIRLNDWYRPFYDALQRRDAASFGFQLLMFAVIAGLLLVLVVAQTWLGETFKMRLREWLTHELADQWLKPNRVYRLGFAGEIGVNPDQRMQEDARHLVELSGVLGIGLLQASLLLVSFVGVLWVLSAQVIFTVEGSSFTIPGYMVWCALAYAGAGSWLAWRAGNPLIRLNVVRYSREAELRAALVRINESGEGIALYGGETDECRTLHATIERVIAIMRELVSGLARLTWVTSGYGWLAIVVPVLVAAPGYFSGQLSLGGLMVVVGAFNQVQQSLRWFVDNFSQIADWRATLERIVSFRDALTTLETLGDDCGRITLVEGSEDRVRLEDLHVIAADGPITLDEKEFLVEPGERVHMVGDRGSGKSIMFRAIAGLWPWGSGTIHIPPRDTVLFMPQHPYLPPGSLRATVAYPSAPASFDDAAVRAALERLGLGHLGATLDRIAIWNKDVPLDEQQRIAFARLLLHKPRWVVMDEALEALDDEHQEIARSLFEQELADVAVIGIGRQSEESEENGFYDRTVQIVQSTGGMRVRLRPRGAQPAGADPMSLCEGLPPEVDDSAEARPKLAPAR